MPRRKGAEGGFDDRTILPIVDLPYMAREAERRYTPSFMSCLTRASCSSLLLFNSDFAARWHTVLTTVVKLIIVTELSRPNNGQKIVEY